MKAEHVLELSSDLTAIEPSIEYLAERCSEGGFDPRRLRLNFRVGVAEALANAMMYGNNNDPSKRVRVEVECTSDAVTVKVTDEGLGFDPATLPDPTTPAHRTRPCGRGIFLIRKLMDRVEFNDHGNSITMVLYRHPERARRREH